MLVPQEPGAEQQEGPGGPGHQHTATRQVQGGYVYYIYLRLLDKFIAVNSGYWTSLLHLQVVKSVISPATRQVLYKVVKPAISPAT